METQATFIGRVNAVSLALVSMTLATSLNAGVINNSNPDTATGFFKGDCGTVGTTTACVGAWNLDNVQVNLIRVPGHTVFDTAFNKSTGAYTAMTYGDSYESLVMDGAAKMGRVVGKDWPVGEPSAIKAITGDTGVKNGKPQNCLINSSFLSAEDSGDPAAAYLDSSHPQPVICSSPFQSHKRFKVRMLSGSVEGVIPSAGGANMGHGIDLVFNVTDGGGLKPYQVFSKIENFTGMRLKGYKIVVGRGVGTAFQSASDLGIADKLHLSLGIAEGSTRGSGASGQVFNGSDLFEDDGLATFSHGFFGAPDTHFDENGFFDTQRAGFAVVQACTTMATGQTVACPAGYLGPDGSTPLMNSDTIYSTTRLTNSYDGFFGDWLPSKWQPKGVFFDTDGDPTTDGKLVAWWDGSAWRKNFDSGFAIASPAEVNAWAGNPLYGVEDLEDVLNLGINYIVKVGDGVGSDFTVRIIPVVADLQEEPVWMAASAVAPALVYDPTMAPAPVATLPTSSGGGGGGCTMATGNAPIDPMLPMLAAVGLIGLGLRRLRNWRANR